jgi:outer membrane receptor protein involved in Fe transport
MIKATILFLSLLAFVAPPAVAQQGASSAAETEGDRTTLAEVIVTAQRRSENLQNVPIAVSALSADQLASSGIQNTSELAEVVPGLTTVNIAGQFLPHIRGIGTTAYGAGFENSVAVYIDGVYLAATPASLLSLNNIAQVEVLKGPQGTLFGRNATGGLIQVATKDPQSTFSGLASLNYGNYQTVSGDLYLTGPVIREALVADFAVSASTQGEGYGRNLFNGQDVYKMDRNIAARSKWVWTPADATRVTLAVDYEEMAGSQFTTFQITPGTKVLFGPGTPLGPPGSSAGPPPSTYDVNEDYQPNDSFKGGGGSIHIEQDFGFAKLVDITAARYSRDNLAFDADATTLSLETINPVIEEDRQFTQELQLRSEDNTRFTWVVGAFYLHSDALTDPSTVFLGGPLISPLFPVESIAIYGQQKTNSWAAYGQSTLAFTEADHLTLGFRYTEEQRHLIATEDGLLVGGIPVYPLNGANPPSFAPTNPFAPAPPISESKKFTAPTWRASYDHRFSDDVLAYVSYNRGFKSGGFNTGVPTQPAYSPEHLDAFEVGLKTDLNRRLRLDAAAYYYKYKNIQVGYFVQGQLAYYNGASARIYGLDSDLQAIVTDHLTVSAGVSWIHDRYTSFPNAIYYIPNSFLGGNATPIMSAAGNRLPLTPDETFNMAADYRYPLAGGGALGLNVTYLYSTRYVFEPDNLHYQSAYNLVNSRIGWTAPGDRLTVSLWGKNLTGEVVANALLASPLGSLSEYQPPRTYGVAVQLKF